MKLNTETATGHCLELAFWLFFAFLGLLLPCSNANSFCGKMLNTPRRPCFVNWLLWRGTLCACPSLGPGPHLLKSKPLQIYAVEGQQTVVKVKELQAIAISSVRWWAKPTKAQSIFEYSTTMQDNDTQVTLIMSKELDRVRIRYQIQYTSSSGSEKKFKSSTATLNLAGTNTFYLTVYCVRTPVLSDGHECPNMCTHTNTCLMYLYCFRCLQCCTSK
jgi:hypothetical protein